MGGSAHCPWALQKNPGEKANTLAQLLGCDLNTNSNTKGMVDCMKYKTGEEVLLAELKMKVSQC